MSPFRDNVDLDDKLLTMLIGNSSRRTSLWATDGNDSMMSVAMSSAIKSGRWTLIRWVGVQV